MTEPQVTESSGTRNSGIAITIIGSFSDPTVSFGSSSHKQKAVCWIMRAADEPGGIDEPLIVDLDPERRKDAPPAEPHA